MRINSGYYKVSQSIPTTGATVDRASQDGSQHTSCNCDKDAVTVSLSSGSSEKAETRKYQTYNHKAVLKTASVPLDHPRGGRAEKPSESTKDPSTEVKSDTEKEEVRKLKARDSEVKQHEQTHAASLGPYKSGGPKYTYETGPDGKRYATGGSVPVDLSPEKDPEQTMRKMQTIKRAAMAPAEPSAGDKQVAAQANQIESQARAQAAEEKQNESGNS
ncbi:MAG: putative metalloprotease CJM1_0395 family protein [bacterium]|nr:putative metalloprotease CJM1_0395 family protein [bacterium]